MQQNFRLHCAICWLNCWLLFLFTLRYYNASRLGILIKSTIYTYSVDSHCYQFSNVDFGFELLSCRHIHPVANEARFYTFHITNASAAASVSSPCQCKCQCGWTVQVEAWRYLKLDKQLHLVFRLFFVFFAWKYVQICT